MGKLTEAQKEQARAMISSGVMRKDVEKKLGVSPQAISRATEGISKPEMRGKHNLNKAPKRFGFREDLEW